MRKESQDERALSLYRQGMLIAASSRWIAVALAVSALAVLWDSPNTRQLPALAVGVSYGLFAAGAFLWLRRHPRDRTVKRMHDVVDGLAVGAGAALSGGLESPIWLLLYPHVVASSVRRGLAYSLGLGMLDAVIVVGLARLTPEQPTGMLHALALLCCALMGGTTSSYLHQIQGRLAETNEELSRKNLQLSETVAASEASQREQERAVARLAESEERYRGLLGRIQDGVLILQDGKISYANEVLARIVQRSRDELLGMEFHDLVPEEDRPKLKALYRRWEQSQAGTGALDSRVRTRDGHNRLVSLRAGAAEFEGKRAVIATVRDMTRERKLEARTRSTLIELTEANRRLEELDKLRLEYLQNMSHEFRSPLTVVRGYAEYLMDSGAPEPAALRHLTRVMLESCDRLIDLVDTLLEVGRIEQGRAAEALQVQDLDLQELAAQSVDPLRPLADRKGISLTLEFPSVPLSLQGDSRLLHQVVRNLVDNAVKYSPAGSEVVVRGRSEVGSALALEVEDKGIGIPEEHLPRIFDKFYMVDGGIARRVSGTGVGLYLVREIVRLHNGAVGVTSRPGEGSLFAIFCPGASKPNGRARDAREKKRTRRWCLVPRSRISRLWPGGSAVAHHR